MDDPTARLLLIIGVAIGNMVLPVGTAELRRFPSLATSRNDMRRFLL